MKNYTWKESLKSAGVIPQPTIQPGTSPLKPAPGSPSDGYYDWRNLAYGDTPLVRLPPEVQAANSVVPATTPSLPDISLSDTYSDVVPEAGRQIPLGDGPLDQGNIADYESPSRLSQLQSLLSEYSPNLIGGGVGGLGGYLTSSLLDDDPDEEGLTPEERRARIAANRRRAALLSLGGAGLGAAAPYLNERFDLVNKAKELVGIA